MRFSKARWKLLGSLLTTYGYALVGTGAAQTFSHEGALVNFTLVAGALVGVVFQAIALYIAPKGE